MIIGVDFDNTIASYDELMYRLAVNWEWIATDLPKSKRHIRDAIRALPEGESKWRRLQTYCYGRGMCEARPMDGVKEFLAKSKALGVPVWVVSHKTQYANFEDAGVNLRTAAVKWMLDQNFFDAVSFGIGQDRLYFESTRQEKIDRIKALGITHFIDDLEETFLEPSFPVDVKKILFTPLVSNCAPANCTSFGNWRDIRLHLFGE